ncbi:MAG: Hpt domain-containing protein [Lachnospiraceae bacterium]|nr:Hpt domain-containing protein [Lachnospiraceae bacterium]
MKQYTLFSKEIDKLDEDGRLKRQELIEGRKFAQINRVRKLGLRHALILFLLFAAQGVLLYLLPEAFIVPICIAAFAIDIMFIYGFCKRMGGCVDGNFQSGKEIYESAIDEMLHALKKEKKQDIAKDSYLEELSYDIEIPIGAILNIDEKILRDTTEQNIIELAAKLKGGMDIMRVYVKDLCTASRLGIESLEIHEAPYDLGIMICDIENIAIRMADEKGIRLLIEVNNDMPTVLEGDNLHIELIILKLIGNALKYTDEGQVIFNITCVGGGDKETMLSVSVKDTGCGIKEEDLDKYFSKDKRAEDAITDGCSIGMALTKMLLEKMGSELRVESKLSVGSEFRFLVKQKVVDASPVGKREDAIARYRDMDNAKRANPPKTDASEPAKETVEAPIKVTEAVTADAKGPTEPTPAVTPESSGTSGDEFIDKLKKIDILSPDDGIKNSGSVDIYKKAVSDFCDSGGAKADDIEMYYEKEDIRNYTIEVHALKSAARIIGAIKLSRLAEALEEAGNAEDMVRIRNATGELIKMYRNLIVSLEEARGDSEEKATIDEESLKDALKSLREFAEVFDFDSIDFVMNELKKYSMPEAYREKYAKLKTLVAQVARDDILLFLEDI